MRRIDAALVIALGAAFCTPVAAQTPLSAIDWLDEAPTVAAPRVITDPEAPSATGVSTPEVTVMALGDADYEAVGLLPPSVTGLPATLWAASDADAILSLWARTADDPLPAVQALYYTLLLAEAEPPGGAEGAFLKARVDALLRLGAVEPAQALLTRAGPNTPALFTQWFDLSLLRGDEAEACTRLMASRALHPDQAAQIYCATLTGDWPTSALLYDTGVALGIFTSTESYLLERFLDPELAEESVERPPVQDPSSLIFQLYEAIGTPLPTRGLPLSYAVADLRGNAGWKAELEAAERLVRTGALSENRLLGLYTSRDPAASGGIWDRVEAVQEFDRALTRQDAEALASTLPRVWRMMSDAHLEIAFARLFAEGLTRAAPRLDPAAQALAYRISLLGEDYEAAAKFPAPRRAARFLASVAMGTPDAVLASSPKEQMIARVFTASPSPSFDHARLLSDGKLGEAILAAAIQLDDANGDLIQTAEALATLRAVGLEDTARRAALQLLILDRRG